jgi:hypothetical protein
LTLSIEALGAFEAFCEAFRGKVAVLWLIRGKVAMAGPMHGNPVGGIDR